jgi:hypothetical protein
LPPMATPMTVKMPDPMTAPMPRAVNDTGPRVLRRAFSGSSDSLISLSMDFVAKICLGRAWTSSRRIYRIVMIVCARLVEALCHASLDDEGVAGGHLERAAGAVLGAELAQMMVDVFVG